ncbi:hypothetical protein Rhal01_03761 [Rubritalea halochordaticola]|uniref:DUF2750 domain-containing protein n=1 Tax=Rubritalea halochordaticola TaxID=714537 RepID=A0ABP9V4L6_9BACT
MKQVHPKELEEVIKLPAPDRYQYFINTVVDWEEAWGLYDDGWAMSASENGDRVFPLWPARAYAEACVEGEWSGYSAEVITLEDLLVGLLPQLVEDGVFPGVFFTPDQGSVDVKAEQLRNDLLEVCEDYE